MHNKLKQRIAVVTFLISAVVFSITFSALKFGPEKSDLNFNVTNVAVANSKPQVFQTLVESYGVMEPTHFIPIQTNASGTITWLADDLHVNRWFEEGAVIAQVSNMYTMTDVRAPCDGLMMDDDLRIGQSVAPDQRLSEFTCSDIFQVSVSIPDDDIPWLLDDNSQLQQTTAYLGHHQATILGFIPDKDGSNPSRLLLSFDDPLSGLTPLMLGSIVQPVIKGKMIERVYQLPHSALHSNNEIWLEVAGALVMQQVRIINHEEDEVWVTFNTEDNSYSDINVVVSSIDRPYIGMPLKIEQAV